MSQAFIGEIIIFAGYFSPANWAFCNGQVFNINSQAALYSLLGSSYGGNGRTTFSLPDLRGRLPAGQGQGTGLSKRTIGQKFGDETVTLALNQIPAHTHTLQASTAAGNSDNPVGHLLADVSSQGGEFYRDQSASGGKEVALNSNQVQTAGDNQPHNNFMPYLAINFVCCLNGIYPSRS